MRTIALAALLSLLPLTAFAADTCSLTVKVENHGQPVAGANVELHSIPRKATTNKDGLATFSQVEPGEHTVVLAYNDYSGSQKISLTGSDKAVDMNISIQLSSQKSSFLNYSTHPLTVILLLIILGLLFLLLKRHRSHG